ncbi:MAG: hypothetical protein GXP25_11350 [Planctomycetes bacterium]|nr:hypothetical protein [Planctomycetota bacterium]
MTAIVRNALLRFIPAACCFVGLGLFAQPNDKPTTEMAKNPGFEVTAAARKNRKETKYGVWQVKGTSEAAGWSLNDAYPGTFEVVTSQKGEARTGKNFIRVTAPTKRAAHIYQRTSAIRPKRWYLYSAWVRGGDIELIIYEYSDRTWLRTKTIAHGTGTEGRWTHVWTLYRVPATEVSTVGLAISVPAGSTTDVDDVSFRPVGRQGKPAADGRTVLTIPEQLTGPPGRIVPPRVPGVTEELLGNDIRLRSIRTNVFHYKRAAAAKGGPSIAVPLQKADPDSVELAFAECAAFGLRVLSSEEGRKTAGKYRKFISQQPHLFQNLNQAADVAVLFSAAGAPAHVEDAAFVVARLAQAQIPFQVVPVEKCTADALAPFKVVVVPCLAQATDDVAKAVEGFVDRGGTVAASGDVLSRDEKGGARLSTLIARTKFESSKDSYRHGTLGKGRVFHAAGQFDDESLWQGLREGIRTGPILVVRRVGEPIRLNALVAADGSLVLHLVDYGITRRDGGAVEGLPILAKIVPGARVVGIRAYTPDEPAPEQIEFTQYGNQVFCTIPKIKAYLVLEIRLRR